MLKRKNKTQKPLKKESFIFSDKFLEQKYDKKSILTWFCI